MAKLKGATIIEVLVAMIIILTCSTLATVIYLNVLQSQNSAEKLKAFRMIKEIQRETEEKNNYINEQLSADGFTIEKECKPYKSDTRLIVITFTARNQDGKELMKQSKLIAGE